MECRRYKLIVPTIPKDIRYLIYNVDVLYEYLPINSICVIGSDEIKPMLPNDKGIEFIKETDIVDFGAVKKYIINRTGKEEDGKRTGWYVQQFIKMGYSRLCNDDYYLLWDSDTVPVKPVKMFDGSVPFFDCKKEYHKDYFDTIGKLLPGLKKCQEGSFISEHMLINTTLMREMLDAIEENGDIEGKSFEEKIINAVSVEALPKSGFSEFETFGTYVATKYPNAYKLRKWKSMRFGGFFFSRCNALTKDNLEWISRKYDAISFEKGDTKSAFASMVSSAGFEEIFAPGSMEALAFIVRVFRKATRNVTIRSSQPSTSTREVPLRGERQSSKEEMP